MFTLQSGQCHLRIRVGLLHPMVGRRVLTGRSERKRSQDKIYPKGYVEMLEQQQAQLVSGLKEMYQRLQKASAWEGPSLDETSGHPLTHDILSALNLLELKHDDSGEPETFEENCDKLQSKMVSEGANYVRRRGSISSESEHNAFAQRDARPTQATDIQRELQFLQRWYIPTYAKSRPSITAAVCCTITSSNLTVTRICVHQRPTNIRE
jgi:hypothetical protein